MGERNIEIILSSFIARLSVRDEDGLRFAASKGKFTLIYEPKTKDTERLEESIEIFVLPNQAQRLDSVPLKGTLFQDTDRDRGRFVRIVRRVKRRLVIYIPVLAALGSILHIVGWL